VPIHAAVESLTNGPLVKEIADTDAFDLDSVYDHPNPALGLADASLRPKTSTDLLVWA